MEPAESSDELRVLLVEDSPRIAERIRELLTQEGRVRILATVDNESSAIQALRQLPVDLMILDLQLKMGTGFGVLEGAGAQRPPTIVMTNYAQPQYQERARHFGVEHFLNKALDFEKLPTLVAGLRPNQRSAPV
jgi:CheY-like chemotaxis protein